MQNRLMHVCLAVEALLRTSSSSNRQRIEIEVREIMTHTPIPRPKLLFVEEVADMLGRSPAQLRWMIHAGTAPKHAKIAGRLCFRESDVTQFIEDAFAQAG